MHGIFMVCSPIMWFLAEEGPMNVSPLHAPDLPILFLSVLGKLATGMPRTYTPGDPRFALAQQLLRRAHMPLPDDVVAQVAQELVLLSDAIASRAELIAQFDDVERTVRHIALGVEVALAGQVVGVPLFAPVIATRPHYGVGA